MAPLPYAPVFALRYTAMHHVDIYVARELSKRKTVVGPTLGGKRRVYRPFVVDVGMHGQILLLVGD